MGCGEGGCVIFFTMFFSRFAFASFCVSPKPLIFLRVPFGFLPAAFSAHHNSLPRTFVL